MNRTLSKYSLLVPKVEVIRYLVERGADATVQSKHGLTPLHLASGAPYPRCVPSPFMSKGNRWSGSLSTNYVELVRFLLERGADATAQSKHGLTPIHLASQGGYLEVTHVLIEHGADATAQDNEGMTPLHFASERGHLEVAHFLVEWGADATIQD